MSVFTSDDFEPPGEPRWLVIGAVLVVVPIVAATVAAVVIGGWWLLRTVTCG